MRGVDDEGEDGGVGANADGSRATWRQDSSQGPNKTWAAYCRLKINLVAKLPAATAGLVSLHSIMCEHNWAT